ncbi:MAG: hypothetical protein ACTHU0_02660 [Kofleriaceae bacterium]
MKQFEILQAAATVAAGLASQRTPVDEHDYEWIAKHSVGIVVEIMRVQTAVFETFLSLEKGD